MHDDIQNNDTSKQNEEKQYEESKNANTHVRKDKKQHDNNDELKSNYHFQQHDNMFDYRVHNDKSNFYNIKPNINNTNSYSNINSNTNNLYQFHNRMPREEGNNMNLFNHSTPKAMIFPNEVSKNNIYIRDERNHQQQESEHIDKYRYPDTAFNKQFIKAPHYKQNPQRFIHDPNMYIKETPHGSNFIDDRHSNFDSMYNPQNGYLKHSDIRTNNVLGNPSMINNPDLQRITQRRQKIMANNQFYNNGYNDDRMNFASHGNIQEEPGSHNPIGDGKVKFPETDSNLYLHPNNNSLYTNKNSHLNFRQNTSQRVYQDYNGPPNHNIGQYPNINNTPTNFNRVFTTQNSLFKRYENKKSIRSTTKTEYTSVGHKKSYINNITPHPTKANADLYTSKYTTSPHYATFKNINIRPKPSTPDTYNNPMNFNTYNREIDINNQSTLKNNIIPPQTRQTNPMRTPSPNNNVLTRNNMLIFIKMVKNKFKKHIIKNDMALNDFFQDKGNNIEGFNSNNQMGVSFPVNDGLLFPPELNFFTSKIVPCKSLVSCINNEDIMKRDNLRKELYSSFNNFKELYNRFNEKMNLKYNFKDPKLTDRMLSIVLSYNNRLSIYKNRTSPDKHNNNNSQISNNIDKHNIKFENNHTNKDDELLEFYFNSNNNKLSGKEFMCYFEYFYPFEQFLNNLEYIEIYKTSILERTNKKLRPLEYECKYKFNFSDNNQIFHNEQLEDDYGIIFNVNKIDKRNIDKVYQVYNEIEEYLLDKNIIYFRDSDTKYLNIENNNITEKDTPTHIINKLTDKHTKKPLTYNIYKNNYLFSYIESNIKYYCDIFNKYNLIELKDYMLKLLFSNYLECIDYISENKNKLLRSILLRVNPNLTNNKNKIKEEIYEQHNSLDNILKNTIILTKNKNNIKNIKNMFIVSNINTIYMYIMNNNIDLLLLYNIRVYINQLSKNKRKRIIKKYDNEIFKVVEEYLSLNTFNENIKIEDNKNINDGISIINTDDKNILKNLDINNKIEIILILTRGIKTYEFLLRRKNIFKNKYFSSKKLEVNREDDNIEYLEKGYEKNKNDYIKIINRKDVTYNTILDILDSQYADEIMDNIK